MVKYTVINGKWRNTNTPDEALNPIEEIELATRIKQVDTITSASPVKISSEKKALLYLILNTTSKQDEVMQQVLNFDSKQLKILQKVS
jgi:hypothetical protein